MARIAVVANSSWNIYNFRLSLIQLLIQEGFDVFVAVPDEDYREEIESVGATYSQTKSLQRKGINPFKDWAYRNELARFYKDKNITISLNYTIKPVIYGGFAVRKVGTKCISTLTGLGYTFIRKGWLNKMVKYLYKKALKNTEVAFFHNEDDLDAFVNERLIQVEKAKVVGGSGIDLNYFSPRPKTKENQFVFLFIGRLLKDKGVRELVEAAQILEKKDCTIRIIGTIDEGNPASINLNDLNIWKQRYNLDFLGELADIRPCLAEADVVVLPSYREGLPKSILEAMAMAKPVIVTDVPGCRQTVPNEQNGLKVPVKDGVALAAAMEQMLSSDEVERLEMGRNGRVIVAELYSKTIVNNTYLKVINIAIGH